MYELCEHMTNKMRRTRVWPFPLVITVETGLCY